MRLFAIDTHAPRAQSDMAKYPRNSPDREMDVITYITHPET